MCVLDRSALAGLKGIPCRFIDIADDVEVAVNPNRSIVAELERTTALMHKPKFAYRSSRWHLVDGKNSTNNNTLFNVALLRDEKYLVTWLRRAGRPPTVPHPL